MLITLYVLLCVNILCLVVFRLSRDARQNVHTPHRSPQQHTMPVSSSRRSSRPSPSYRPIQNSPHANPHSRRASPGGLPPLAGHSHSPAPYSLPPSAHSMQRDDDGPRSLRSYGRGSVYERSAQNLSEAGVEKRGSAHRRCAACLNSQTFWLTWMIMSLVFAVCITVFRHTASTG